MAVRQPNPRGRLQQEARNASGGGEDLRSVVGGDREDGARPVHVARDLVNVHKIDAQALLDHVQQRA